MNVAKCTLTFAVGDGLEHRRKDLDAVLEEDDLVAVKRVVPHGAAEGAQELLGIVVDAAHRDDQIFAAGAGVHARRDEQDGEQQRERDAAGDETYPGEKAHAVRGDAGAPARVAIASGCSISAWRCRATFTPVMHTANQASAAAHPPATSLG